MNRRLLLAFFALSFAITWGLERRGEGEER